MSPQVTNTKQLRPHQTQFIKKLEAAKLAETQTSTDEKLNLLIGEVGMLNRKIEDLQRGSYPLSTVSSALQFISPQPKHVKLSLKQHMMQKPQESSGQCLNDIFKAQAAKQRNSASSSISLNHPRRESKNRDIYDEPIETPVVWT